MNTRYLLIVITFLIALVVIANNAIAQDGQNNSNLLNINKIILTPEERKWLDKHHVVKINVGSAPPYQFRSNPPTGISVDYIKLIAEKIGINIQLDTTPYMWSEKLRMLKDKNGIDMVLTINPTPEREEYIEFTDNYLTSPWVIFNREKDSFIGNISDLYGKTVSVQKGYVVQTLLEKEYPAIKLLVVKNTEDALKAVSTKKADAFIGNLTIGSYSIIRDGFDNLRVAAPTPFGNHSQAMGVRKDWPELASIINKTLHSFTLEEHSEISDRWMSVNPQQGLRWRDVMKWVTPFVFVLLLIILIIYYSYRKLQKETLERKKNEFIVEKFFEQPINVHVIAELNGPVRRVNNGWPNALGYTKEEFEGINFYDILHPDDFEGTKNEMAKLGQGEPVLYFENRYRHKDGSYRLFAWSAIASQEDQLSYAVASDITEKKKYELELKELNEKLELKVQEEVEKNNQKEKLLFEHKRFADMGRMISAIAHQWRQPLNNIYLILQIMEEIDDGIDYEDDKKELYRKIENIVKYMSETIDDFRDYFSDKKEKHNFSIVEEIQGTLSLVDSQLKSQEISVEFKINESDNPYNNEESFLCYGAPGDFRQVLLNIFNNAHDAIIDYQEKNSSEYGKITISIEYESNDCHITIENTGDNIPDDILGRIFHPYFTTKDEGKGTGIGLYMSRMIIEQEMNGKIYAKNTEAGVAVHVLLPQVAQDENAVK